MAGPTTGMLGSSASPRLCDPWPASGIGTSCVDGIAAWSARSMSSFTSRSSDIVELGARRCRCASSQAWSAALRPARHPPPVRCPPGAQSDQLHSPVLWRRVTRSRAAPPKAKSTEIGPFSSSSTSIGVAAAAIAGSSWTCTSPTSVGPTGEAAGVTSGMLSAPKSAPEFPAAAATGAAATASAAPAGAVAAPWLPSSTCVSGKLSALITPAAAAAAAAAPSASPLAEPGERPRQASGTAASAGDCNASSSASLKR